MTRQHKIIPGILLVLMFLAMGVVGCKNGDLVKEANLALEAKKTEITNLEKEISGLKKESADLKQLLAEKPAVPEGMTLVSNDQIKIWDACCASEVARKQKAKVTVAEKGKKRTAKKVVKKIIPVTKADEAAALKAAMATERGAVLLPASPFFVPPIQPKGECFRLTLPQGQGNQ